MKALFIGGVKSGKSLNAEKYTLQYANTKPIYLATTEFFDAEMQERIHKHKLQRGNNFETLEEPIQISRIDTDEDSIILVECISMWINNMLHYEHTFEEIEKELQELTSKYRNIVFVINDVSCSVVSENALTRKFVDINGKISQLLASQCDEVYNTVAGISIKIK